MARADVGSTQAKAAALRAQADREQRRRRALIAAVAAVAVVVVAIGVLVVVRVAGGGSRGATPASPAPSGAAAQVAQQVAAVPPSVLDKVGVGTAQNLPRTVSAPALTADGKPEVLYVGAEFCPYCAAQRWGVAVALARFGTWKGLGTTASSPDDVYPSTPSLSFHGATLTSDVVAFRGYETTDVQRQPLDTLPAADQKVFDTYDGPPYLPAGAKGSIPFLDIGGTRIVGGASTDPQLLAGKTPQQVAAALSDPGSPIAQAVDGTANAVTAAVCAATGGTPKDVCTSPGVTAAARALR